MQGGGSGRPCFFEKEFPMIKWKEEGFLPVEKAEKEGDYVCPICHKILHLEAGQTIPRCCGKPMELMD